MSQQPYTFQARNPVSTQARQPGTYARQGTQPQTYARQGQTPDTYDHRSPFTYARTGQTPVNRWDGVLQQQWPATPVTA